MNRLTIAAAASLLLAACAAGSPFKWSEARKIKEGMSTQEVTALMGKPYSVSAVDDVLRYIWVEISVPDYSTKTLRIDFRDGKVVKVPPIPTELQ